MFQCTGVLFTSNNFCTQTGEQSYVVIRGEKVTRDKTSEIQLTIPELKVSDADKISDSTRSSGIIVTSTHTRMHTRRHIAAATQR